MHVKIKFIVTYKTYFICDTSALNKRAILSANNAINIVIVYIIFNI